MRSSSSLLAVAAATLLTPVNAWFRVACTSPLVSERVDPIISPGVSPSQHVHTIHGASNFAPGSNYNSLRASKCTSCLVPQDLSNYWFPKLYFKDPKTGKFDEVGNGGLLIYYQNRGNLDKGNGGPGLKAFPAGLKMVSGDPRARRRKYADSDNSQAALRERAVFHSCIRAPVAPGYDVYGFPNTNCEGGLNARIHLPACWDGQRVESADNSHVAYLSQIDNGVCPSTHPVGFIKLFYEITWNINEFAKAGRWNPATEPWPFVYATGDPTGFSWHGDFQNGWDTNALQNAIDQCDSSTDQKAGKTEACPFLSVTPAATADQCKIAPIVNEPLTGQLAKLPGCNPIQAGPNDSTLYTAANCPI